MYTRLDKQARDFEQSTISATVPSPNAPPPLDLEPEDEAGGEDED